MKTIDKILTVALSLTIGVFSAQSAPIQITTLPYTVPAPGTYVLTAVSASTLQSRGVFH
jgi:hypothetical protein